MEIIIYNMLRYWKQVYKGDADVRVGEDETRQTFQGTKVSADLEENAFYPEDKLG